MLLLANARAGSADQDTAKRLADELGAEYVVTGSLEELNEVARGWRGETIVVAGGDGSLHAAINALDKAGVLDTVTVGLIPVGTGNDFARGLGLDLDPDEALKTIQQGKEHVLDLIDAGDGSIVINAVHVGVGVDASKAAKKWKSRIGRLGYAAGAIRAGLTPQFRYLEVVLDGEILTVGRPIAQVAIGNASYVGGGAELIPSARSDDGVMHVVVSKAVGFVSRFTYAARVRFGTHEGHHDVETFTGKKISVRGRAFAISADGEISEPHSEYFWQIRPSAVRFIIP